MIKTVMLLTILTAILLAVGWLLGGVIGLIIALVFSLIINGGSYWYSDRIVLRLYKAKPFDDEKIKSILTKICKEAEMTVPPLYVVETDVPNAFATGRDPQHSAVAVTRGLLNHLTEEEIEGVLAHEISHIRNRDVLISTLAATIAGTISFIAQMGYMYVFFGHQERNATQLIGLIVVIIFAPLAAMLVKLAISRQREYKADWTGILFTKKPEALASALEKIEKAAKQQPLHASPATSHLWIVNPLKSDWFTQLFATHPPIEKRVEILRDAAKIV